MVYLIHHRSFEGCQKKFQNSIMDTSLISACKNCESWKVKDLIYAIGVSKLQNLISIWFVHGDCFAADKEIYERIRDCISNNINEIPNVGFSETSELARINKVDPLGITYFRVRGMWGIENPTKVFSYIIEQPPKGAFWFNAIITEEKYKSYPEKDQKDLENLKSSSLKIKDVKVKSPNNPANLINAKLISFIRMEA